MPGAGSDGNAACAMHAVGGVAGGHSLVGYAIVNEKQ
jgi:hypothetical protein